MPIFNFLRKKGKIKMDIGNVYFKFLRKKGKIKMDIGNVYFFFF
jgi:hypothetical protein